jgi:hypothetical protein
MTEHISNVPRQAPPGVEFRGNATIYTPESLRPPEYEPEVGRLTRAEIGRAQALGMTTDEAFLAKVKAYGKEMERFGVESLEEWFVKRPVMQGVGLVPAGPPAWPLPPEPTVESEARRLGMTPDSYVGMQSVENVYDFEQLQEELAHKAEIDAEARRRLEVEEAQRRIAAERSGDEAA